MKGFILKKKVSYFFHGIIGLLANFKQFMIVCTIIYI